MKNVLFALALFGLLLPSATSCQKKYPENKFGSFKRPANRLTSHVWELEAYYIDNELNHDYDSQYYTQTYSELCVGGGDMKCNEGLLTVNALSFNPGLSFLWKMSEDESTFQSVQVGEPYTPTTPNRQILKLTKKEFWYTYVSENGTKHEFRLKRKKN